MTNNLNIINMSNSASILLLTGIAGCAGMAVATRLSLKEVKELDVSLECYNLAKAELNSPNFGWYSRIIDTSSSWHRHTDAEGKVTTRLSYDLKKRVPIINETAVTIGGIFGGILGAAAGFGIGFATSYLFSSQK